MGLSMGLVFLFVRTAFPKFSPLQRLPGSIAYRDAEIYNLQVRLIDEMSGEFQFLVMRTEFYGDNVTWRSPVVTMIAVWQLVLIQLQH